MAAGTEPEEGVGGLACGPVKLRVHVAPGKAASCLCPSGLLGSEEVLFSGRRGVRGGKMACGHSRLPPPAPTTCP